MTGTFTSFSFYLGPLRRRRSSTLTESRLSVVLLPRGVGYWCSFIKVGVGFTRPREDLGSLSLRWGDFRIEIESILKTGCPTF